MQEQNFCCLFCRIFLNMSGEKIFSDIVISNFMDEILVKLSELTSTLVMPVLTDDGNPLVHVTQLQQQ